jgi:sugar lactone lactonase YvrE
LGPGPNPEAGWAGNWSLIAGAGIGHVDYITALAVDGAGSLYVADILYDSVTGQPKDWRVQKRDTQENWSLLASGGQGVYRGGSVTALAADSAGNLYVGMPFQSQQRDIQGNWSPLAIPDNTSGSSGTPDALAVNSAGDLYVAVAGPAVEYTDISQIHMRDTQGNWSVIAPYGTAIGQVRGQFGHPVPAGLAVDGAGHLYVADTGNYRVQVYTPGP